MNIAIIGAVLSGLVCAEKIAAAGHQTTIFEKSRGVGGRMATRRAPCGDFDHGAQYFTVKDSRFSNAVQGWKAAGVVSEWSVRFAAIEGGRIERFSPNPSFQVAVPTMTAIAKHLAQQRHVVTGSQITRLERDADGWLLFEDHGTSHGPFDVVVIAIPAPQATSLLRGHSPLVEIVQTAQLQPCWTVLIELKDPLDVPFDAAFINDEDSPLSWVARTSAKPQRQHHPERWVLQAGPAWSEQHLEVDSDAVIESLCAAFEKAVSLKMSILSIFVHKWRYAYVSQPLGVGALWDADARIGVCGDWCSAARVEGAYLSGLELADQITVGTPVANRDKELSG